ncbi:TetR/AcrR family transcriptional regulator [Streptomyces sp. SID13666]|uniref:TetR/AcrR family transcriptional regulator n=1 Tax=unclassified Streptomyces TaxID=2593676 RepID=UPI001105C6A7|nr:TetR/AcrR family transcriptional regulator [Streptomyces sp. So13.3]NEA57180.1 TetR/AcrR family transcriptional regulator [Streptomyces sp. SID13666]NEA74274.1 TetR/AcrR family transcriptional regulator [Streptomyces sp. SID13588]QNA71966.1 TetR/AcrR family transcriptional regulator [Streptomyces sp. So13.3]
MTPTSVEQGQETRARLLAAAARLIVEEGWGAVTTRKVAAAAGLRPGLVHYHFETVTVLLVEAALDTARREVRGLMAMLSQSAEGPAGVEQALAGMAQYSADDSATILFTEMLLAATRNERLREQLCALLREWRSGVAQWLRDHGATDAEATAVVLGAVIDGLVLNRLIDPGLASVRVDGPLGRLVGFRDGTEASGPS